MKGTVFEAIILWLDSRRHVISRGHLPAWYDLGIGRTCLNCITEGGGPRDGIFRGLARASLPA